MVSWVWIPISLFIGAAIGIFAVALVSANRNYNMNDEE